MPTQAKILVAAFVIAPFLLTLALFIAIVVATHSPSAPPLLPRNEFHYISGYEVIV